ncbi:MAG: ACP phosphodiesterase [Geoalkalibacter sp.]|jgi:acyl carrier protein phosphodiesterase|uniref:acyl carrier protein phosphodiesterase n=1 Tax=Geoalkalibacter sp. TaxID=3041440 RepID=UPI002A977BD6|nr:ACP phosphodiesterase [Thermodesulfobacteriota bacterium]
MNYLMHLYLSDGSDEGLLGNLMGDFVKGSIGDCFSAAVRRGIEEHRRLDAFAQIEPHFKRSRQRLDPQYGHCRGIMVDIFYDHILAREWHHHHPQPLENFAGHVYRLLQDHFDQLPPDLQRIAPRMIEHDWLAGYRNLQVIGKVLQNLSRRLSRPTPLAQSLPQLQIHYPRLREDCRQFIHAARRHLGNPPPTGEKISGL